MIPKTPGRPDEGGGSINNFRKNCKFTSLRNNDSEEPCEGSIVRSSWMATVDDNSSSSSLANAIIINAPSTSTTTTAKFYSSLIYNNEPKVNNNNNTDDSGKTNVRDNNSSNSVGRTKQRGRMGYYENYKRIFSNSSSIILFLLLSSFLIGNSSSSEVSSFQQQHNFGSSGTGSAAGSLSGTGGGLSSSSSSNNNNIGSNNFNINNNNNYNNANNNGIFSNVANNGGNGGSSNIVGSGGNILSSEQPQQPLLPIVPTTTTTTSTSQTPSVLTAYFIIGLANQIRKINSTAMMLLTRGQPFQLQFKTACPFGNIVYDDKFSISINSGGNMTFRNKPNLFPFSTHHNVADGQWHAITFTGSSISLDDHELHDQLSEQIQDRHDINWDTNSSTENDKSRLNHMLHFFDGFVGCIRVPKPAHDHHNGNGRDHHDLQSHEENYNNQPESPSEHRDLTFIDLFNLGNPYHPCDDTGANLSAIHECFEPETFVLCSKCQNGATCQPETPPPDIKNSSDNMNNTCVCPPNTDEIEYSGRYCETPPDPQLVEDSPSHETELVMETGDDMSGSPISSPSNIDSTSANVSMNDSAGSRMSLSISNPAEPPVVTSTTTTEKPEEPFELQTNDDCPCKNRGVCTPSVVDVELHYCNCTNRGYEGRYCETDIDECARDPNKCNNGVCINRNGSYSCYCRPGFAGTHCEKEFNECLSNPCKHGQCEDRIDNYECVCEPGYEGRDCDSDINECLSRNGTNPCENGAECTDLLNDFNCTCLPGYTGKKCEIDIDECENSPCLNGGQCIDKVNGYLCNCDGTGFLGNECENNIDDCLTNHCQNGGTCIDGINGYNCSCYDGYNGQNCENDIDECADLPCKNGDCSQKSNQSLYAPNDPLAREPFNTEFSYDKSAGYHCECHAGYTGENCEIDINECEGNPCGKNGICVDGIASYRCDCHKGFEGEHCETEIDECESNPCVNGKCHDKVGDFECVCPEGYGSKNCSVPLRGCLKSPCGANGKCEAIYIEQFNTHNYTCECYSGFSGRKCSTGTTISFNGSGPVEITNNDKSFENGVYELLFRFRTTLPDVNLAVGQGITYFSLILSGGKLNLQSSLLNNLKGISSGTNLSNAEWHKVWISVNNTHIALASDSEQTIYPISDGQEAHTGFNSTLLGPTNAFNFVSNKGISPFIGCMQDIMINGERIIPEVNLNTTNVEIGCRRRDQCNPNPCENFGTCTDLWQNFTCHCQRPYLGDRCQHKYIAATFHHETMDNSLAKVEISQDIANKFSSTFDISMFVRTRNQSATIFLLGHQNENTGNYSVFLEAEVGEVGNLVVQAKWSDGVDDANSRPETYAVDGLQITDGSPHLISIQRDKGLVKISVNGTEHFRKSVSNKIKFFPTVLYVGGKPIFLGPTAAALTAQAESAVSVTGSGESADNGEDSTSNPESGSANEVSSKENILTGRALTESENLIITRPFKGVIQDLRVNFSSTEPPQTTFGGHSLSAKSQNYYVVEFYPLTLNATYTMGDPLGKVTTQNILNGTVSDDTCKVNPCSNNGVCEVTWNDFQCQCADGYDGKTCEVRLHCAMVKCPEGSTCHNLGWTGFECVSETAFDGKGTISPHYRLLSSELENVTFNEVSFRFRTKQAGNVLYLANGTHSFRIGLEIGPESNKSSGNIAVDVDGKRNDFLVAKILDGQWHSLSAKLMIADTGNTSLNLYIDNGKEQKEIKDLPITSSYLYELVKSPSAEIVIGSHVEQSDRYHLDHDHYETANMNQIGHPENAHNQFYRGCLSDIKIGDYRLPFVTPSQLEQINDNNLTLVRRTSPTAFYIDESHGAGYPHLGCVLCYDVECNNGGRCDNAPEKYECSCVSGFEGDYCQTNIDECLDNYECANGSTCIDEIANFTCICPPGYEGWKCDQEIDECAVYGIHSDGNPCKNGGRCKDEVGKYMCICTDDFLGSNCEKRKRSSCNDKPCENGATCRERTPQPQQQNDVTFECICPQGYEGETCSEMIDYCKNVICANGGTCESKPVGFECHCMPGYDGPECKQDINECDPNPCRHNGSCQDLINGYACECGHTGFEGSTCEQDINECENDMCPPMQRCENTIGSYRCVCPDLTMCGENCDIPDPCYEDGNKTCHNGGSCISTCHDEEDKQWNCACTENYGGQFCELLTMAQPEQPIDLLLIIIPVLAAFLLAATIGVIILVRMARRKRATRGVYSPSQQEYCNPRVELDNVMKPPPEERLI